MECKSKAENIFMINASEKNFINKSFQNITSKTLDDEDFKSKLAREIEKRYHIYVNYFNSNCANHIQKYTKNAELSNLSRVKGNKILLEKTHNSDVHEEIWKLYSKSIALAPLDSEELAQAYGNRSYILLHFKKFEDSIKDINRAIAITKSDPLKVKLICRKITCLAKLGSNQEKYKCYSLVKSIFNDIDESLKDEKLDKLMKQVEEEMAVVKFDKTIKKNKYLPLSTNAVNVVYNDKYGAHLVAARNIMPGETIMVVKPFVTAANSKKSYAYCSHCLTFTWASIPCDYCCLSMFCSEQCKSDAWENYHIVECKILPHMQFDLDLYHYYQMSMRAIFVGVKEAGNITKLQEKLKEIDKSINKYKKGMKTEDITKSDLINFYSLSYEQSLPHFAQFFKNSVLLSALIVQATDFFGKDFKSKNVSEIVENKNILFITSLLIKFSLIASSNIENVNVTGCKIRRTILHCTGCAHVTPTSGMVGVDCNASATRCFTDDGKSVYYCVQPIKKNDRILVNTYNFFFKEEKKSRQYLMNFKNYTCRCKACKENWPVKDILFKIHEKEFEKDHTSKKGTFMIEIIQRYDSVLVYNPNWKDCDLEDFIPDELTLREIAKDTLEAVNLFGQPKFESCYAIDLLVHGFENLYGYHKRCSVPKTC